MFIIDENLLNLQNLDDVPPKSKLRFIRLEPRQNT